MKVTLVLAGLLICGGGVQAADVILNEYNAVDEDKWLEAGAADTYWGRVEGNGGDWFELVVITDHLDMRNWELYMIDGDAYTTTLTLTNHDIWSDLRSGTIITISEEARNDAGDYSPLLGRWWLNAKASDEANGLYVTASNFRVNNKSWQLTIRDNLGAVVFGPAGEGINPLSGIGSDEICKLEDDPSSAITPMSSYNDGHSSTFGSPNLWNDGVDTQDFSVLRSVVSYYPLTSVRINEVLTHSDMPEVDWIELYNTTGSPIDIGGWYLSDRLYDLTRWAIPTDTIIPAEGYMVFDETQFNFALDSVYGDEVYLSEAGSNGVMTGGRDYIEFGAAQNAVSFGRFPDGTGPLYSMSEQTSGAANAYPLVGPVVINEIMYHPPDLPPAGLDNVDHEFIELHNITAAPVNLYTYFAGADETHPWKLTRGVSFSFSLSTTIAAGEYLLVVSFDPAVDLAKLVDFRATYGLDASVPIVGSYSGKLSNWGESIRLRKPDTPQPPGPPDYSYVPYVLVDEVPYNHAAPWPTEPDGLGYSLERIVPTLIGYVPTNWMASEAVGGSPGTVNSCPPPGDYDGDGDVDLDDYGFFHDCFTAPGGGLASPRCTCFDTDTDGDVDLADFRAFQIAFG
ncbi:MAG: lamin tail domain-containing protein, partial [Phycisphaerae bacterium]|nr:lamin tail domain-containing protein [Phycisphaerae bacterium]